MYSKLYALIFSIIIAADITSCLDGKRSSCQDYCSFKTKRSHELINRTRSTDMFLSYHLH